MRHCRAHALLVFLHCHSAHVLVLGYGGPVKNYPHVKIWTGSPSSLSIGAQDTGDTSSHAKAALTTRRLTCRPPSDAHKTQADGFVEGQRRSTQTCVTPPRRLQRRLGRLVLLRGVGPGGSGRCPCCCHLSTGRRGGVRGEDAAGGRRRGRRGRGGG